MVNYPSSLDDDDSLYVAVNNCRTVLASGISNSDVSFPVVSTSLFPDSGLASIENEVFLFTSKTSTTLDGITRGEDGTSAVSHVSGEDVQLRVVAGHHNALKDGVVAVETAMGVPVSPASGTVHYRLDTLEAINVSVVSGSLTLSSEDYVLVNASAGEVILTLPAASQYNGHAYNIKKTDSSSNYVIASGTGNTIDGDSTATITTQYAALTLVSDSNDWYIF